MRDHRNLKAFQLVDELALLIYQVSRAFPREELYGLTSQMRRAAVSIPSNIVEGCARESETEYLRFLEIAYGSLRELEYQISLAYRLGYINSGTPIASNLDKLLDESGKVLAGLIRSFRRNTKFPKASSLQPPAQSPTA
jgi:four helix bundle protein